MFNLHRFTIPFATNYGRIAVAISIIVVSAGAIFPPALLMFFIVMAVAYFTPDSKEYLSDSQEDVLDRIGDWRGIPYFLFSAWSCFIVIVVSVFNFSVTKAGLFEWLKIGNASIFTNQIRFICEQKVNFQNDLQCNSENWNLVSILYLYGVQALIVQDIVLVYLLRAPAWHAILVNLKRWQLIGQILMFSIVLVGLGFVMYEAIDPTITYLAFSSTALSQLSYSLFTFLLAMFSGGVLMIFYQVILNFYVLIFGNKENFRS